jgi:NAD(P)-dependent dehydrogenase (short-subunit alcohol dehydrogenase family)
MAEDRTAIVTGAARRVGRAIAEGLLEAGWTVLAHVRKGSDGVPVGAAKVAVDLEDEGAAVAIFDAAGALPPVQLLINNAARFAWDRPGAFDAQEFARHLAINARAPAALIEELARRHLPGSDAGVVNLLDSKLVAPNSDYLSYTVSKHALLQLTDLYARALASAGIRVNAVAPSLMMRSSGQSEENFEAMRANNPLHRPVEPNDVVAAILYLADAKAVTGQTIVIDGGQRFMALERDVQFLGPGANAG